VILRVKKLHPQAKLPEYKTEGAVGLDLCSVEEIEIPPKQYKTIGTGIAVEIEKGYEGEIRPRSGLALKYGIGVLNSPGTVDWDYRGEIKVILFNFSNSTFRIKKGMRVAQFVVNKIYKPKIIEVNSLSTTRRGGGGFGSTGE
jgi:dUTP pyrophosphatase